MTDAVDTKERISGAILTQFEELRKIIERGSQATCYMVNERLLNTYWLVGGYISYKIKSSEWGNKVVDRFSEYMRQKSPDIKGYGRSSLYSIIKFYETYSAPEFTEFLVSLPQIPEIVQYSIGQLETSDNQMDIIVQEKIGQLSEHFNSLFAQYYSSFSVYNK